MTRRVLLAALLAFAATAAATEAWRVGNKLIRVGDEVSRVIRLAGKPDYREQLETRFGGAAGHRWHYVKTGYNAKTVIITIKGGKVVSIEMEKH